VIYPDAASRIEAALEVHGPLTEAQIQKETSLAPGASQNGIRNLLREGRIIRAGGTEKRPKWGRR
jgi:hypothetical protein